MTTSINQHFSPWSLLKFAFPSIIMMMFMSLYTIVDGIFVSRFVGSNALSSLNIAFPAASVVIAVGTMLATGGTAVISKYLGEGKKREARERCLPIRKHRGAREKRYSFGYAVFLILALMK